MNTKIIILILIIIAGVAVFWFYDKNKKQEQSQPTIIEKEGMQIEILNKGTGPEAKVGYTVTVNYIGTLENGKKFDSSYDRETPFSFTLGADNVIKGWDIGVEGMRVGEKRRLTIPSELAYGPNGVPGAIPPNATLIFEVELLGIK